jgi:hypothetical protein
MPLTDAQIQFLTRFLGVSPLDAQDSPDEITSSADHSNADALRKDLKAIEMDLTVEISRLDGQIAQNRDRFARIGANHLASLEKVETALVQAGSRSMEPVQRLYKQVNYLHAEYMKLVARGVPSATTYRDQIDEQSKPIRVAETEGKALLARLDAALIKVLAAGEVAWQAYQAKQEKARTEWEAESATLETGLNRLDDLGSGYAADLQSIFYFNVKTAEKDYNAALSEVRSLAQKCKVAQKNHDEAIGEIREARQQQFNEIKKAMPPQTKLDALQRKLGEMTGTLDVKKLFTEPMEQAEKILKTANNPKAFVAALAIAKEAEVLFNDYTRSEKEVEQMSWDRAAIKRVLDYYKTDRPKDYKALQSRFDSLEKGWSKMKPSVAAKTYADLNKDVGADTQSTWVWENFAGRCNKDRQWRDQFKLRASEVKENLDKLDTRIKKSQTEGKAEGYQGQALAEYRGLVAAGDGELSEFAVATALSKRLSALGDKVKLYLAVPIADLIKPANELKGAAAQLVGDQAKGMERRDAYLKRYEFLKILHQEAIDAHKALADQSYSEDDKREFEDIHTMINKAAEIAKAKKDESDLQDVEAAIAISERCKIRLATLGKGGENVDRGKLALVQQDWTNGLAIFRGELDALVKAVKDLTDLEPRPVAGDDEKPAQGGADKKPAELSFYGADTGVRVAADVVLAYFDKFNFSKEVVALTLDGDENRGERKHARETTLSKIRDAMGYLLGNPANRLFMKNYFGENSVGRAFYRSMRRIELEVLRGV